MTAPGRPAYPVPGAPVPGIMDRGYRCPSPGAPPQGPWSLHWRNIADMRVRDVRYLGAALSYPHWQYYCGTPGGIWSHPPTPPC